MSVQVLGVPDGQLTVRLAQLLSIAHNTATAAATIATVAAAVAIAAAIAAAAAAAAAAVATAEVAELAIIMLCYEADEVATKMLQR